MNIHPLAVVSPQAQIGSGVRIGPFAIVEDDVTIGEGCQLTGHAVVKSGTIMGPNNTVCEAAVIGGRPQHVRCPSDIGNVIIGAGNTFREGSTVHRAVKPDASTIIGDNIYVMAGAHIAHDCHLGNHIVMANNCLLAGHVSVGDRAFISGGVAVHQFCRIGRMAMVGGHARVVRDVPPYVTIDGLSGDVVGLNLVGLKRNGFSPDDIIVLKEAYRLIYRSGLTWQEMLEQLTANFSDGPAAEMVAFLHAGTRGFCQERRQPPGVTLKIRPNLDEIEQPVRALTIAQPRQLIAKAG